HLLLITLAVAPRPSFSHRERRSPIHIAVCRLGSTVATAKLALGSFAVGRPRGPACICLQEFRDLFFGQMGAFRMEIAFRNAMAIGEGHLIKIPILVVKNAD